MTPPDRTAVARLHAFVEARCGLAIDEHREALLAGVLEQRIRARGGSMERYWRCLEDPTCADSEIRALAECLTVGETYFFRNPDQFRALAERVLPDRVEARGTDRRLRLLSAGCSSGEEAYTMAIVLAQAPQFRDWELSITAVDINEAALARATEGRYTAWSLRGVPGAIQERWFERAGSLLVVDPDLRSRVDFRAANLLDPNDSLWAEEPFDVVFCRNMLMYLVPEAARNVIERIRRALFPGGFLFLGHAETLRGVTGEFSLIQSHGTFFYRIGPELAPPSTGRGRNAPVAPEADLDAGPPQRSIAWFERIHQSSARIERLVDRPAPPQPEVLAKESVTVEPPCDLERALELMGQERFGQARAWLEGLPGPRRSRPDAQLLLAAARFNTRDVEGAESACQQIIAGEDSAASAHYLLALCREAAGDLAGAVRHDHVAMSLDPRFAMPHLHAGLLARASADEATAIRELDLALGLLESESSARILVFGGGFDRQALLNFCRRAVHPLREA